MTKIRPDSRMIKMQSNAGRMAKPGKIGPLKRLEREMEQGGGNLRQKGGQGERITPRTKVTTVSIKPKRKPK